MVPLRVADSSTKAMNKASTFVYWTCLIYDIRTRIVLTRKPFQMFQTVFLTCADDGIGKVDRSTLSQQALMELFIFGFDNVDDICGSRENPKEVCTWKAVKFNADGEVVSFEWPFKMEHGTGTVGFKCLPTSIKHLEMSPNENQSNLQISQEI